MLIKSFIKKILGESPQPFHKHDQGQRQVSVIDFITRDNPKITIIKGRTGYRLVWVVVTDDIKAVVRRTKATETLCDYLDFILSFGKETELTVSLDSLPPAQIFDDLTSHPIMIYFPEYKPGRLADLSRY